MILNAGGTHNVRVLRQNAGNAVRGGLELRRLARMASEAFLETVFAWDA